MLAREIGTQKLPVTATELNASSRCFQWKPGCVEVGNALLEQSLGRRRFGVVPVGIAGSTQQATPFSPILHMRGRALQQRHRTTPSKAAFHWT